jgi:hypothetical protein
MIMGLLKRFARSRFWKWFASKYVAHLTFRTMGYTKFPMTDYFKMVDLAKPGRVYGFASIDTDSLAAKVIKRIVPGKTLTTHGGVIRFDGDRASIIAHMKGKGLVVVHPLDVLRENDYFAVIEVPVVKGGEEEVNRRLDWCIANKARIKYDFPQELNKRHIGSLMKKERKLSADLLVYCSEFFRELFLGLATDSDFKPIKVLDREAFDPDTIIKSGKVVYTNHPDLVQQ